jgi:hypothetical protein
MADAVVLDPEAGDAEMMRQRRSLRGRPIADSITKRCIASSGMNNAVEPAHSAIAKFRRRR